MSSHSTNSIDLTSTNNFVIPPSAVEPQVGLFTDNLSGKKRKFSEIVDLTEEKVIDLTQKKVIDLSKEKSKFFYVLKCSDSNVKYYVGETTNLTDLLLGRLRPKFSKNFEKCSVIRVISSKNYLNRTSIVLYYMLRFGIDNVRGGGYTNEVLSDVSIRNLKHVLSTLNLSMSFDQVAEKYRKIAELNCDIYFASKKFNLNYYQMMNDKFYSILNNPNFKLLKNTKYLTRSLKRKALPEINFKC